MVARRWLRILATCGYPVACTLDASGLGTPEADALTQAGAETWSFPGPEADGGETASGTADGPSGEPLGTFGGTESRADDEGVSSGRIDLDSTGGDTTMGSTDGATTTDEELGPCSGPPSFTSVILFTLANSDIVDTDDIVYADANGFDGDDDDDLALFGGEVVFAGRSTDDGNPARFRVDFELECPTEVFVWGLVYDESATEVNVDAFDWQLEADAGRWDFGCEGNNIGWQWERVHALGQGCNFSPFVPFLQAGSHRIEFTDGEGDPPGNPGGPPRMAGIVVTNDPDLDPERTIFPVE